MEAVQISINERMDKQIMVYMYNGILLSHKQKRSTDICYNMDESWNLKNIKLSERGQTQKVKWFMIPFIQNN